MKFGSLILAAGHGKRTACDTPKPLLPLESKTLLDFVVESVNKSFQDGVVHHHVLVGHKAEMITEHVKNKYPSATCVLQEPQLGTGHAVKVFCNAVKNHLDYVVVICADTPLISHEAIGRMLAVAREKKSDAVVATVEVKDATGYGRVFETNGTVKIIEHKDIDSSLYSHNIINTGLYVFKYDFLKSNIDKLTNQNASKEFYLTDIFLHTNNTATEKFEDADQFLGINTLEQLAQIAKILNTRKLTALLKSGVFIQHPETTHIEHDVVVGKNSVIGPNVMIKGKSTIGVGCKIHQGSIISNSFLDENVEILPYCVVNDSKIEKFSSVGPFAHLRPNSSLGEKVKIGNFVEVKKSRFEKGSKASHLSYIGDASIGENSNLGCGFITCNYDGIKKYETKIGKNCFIGSDSQLIAPVNIGDRCFIAAGSTINKDIPDDGFAISRGKQSVKEGMARKYIKTKE